MRQEAFNEIFRNRTKKLALEIIKVVSKLAYSAALGVIRKQLIRSTTTVTANFRAVCRARSDRERYAKLCIVVEEADEVLFWIELIIKSGLISKEELSSANREAEEILKVMSTFKKRLAPTH